MYLVFLLGFQIKEKVKNEDVIEFFLTLILYFIILFGIIQIFSGNLIFKTSVYRLSPIYGDNVTGFSLLLTTLYTYFLHKFFLNKNYLNLTYLILIFSMIIATQSRVAIISSLLLILIYYIISIRLKFKFILLLTFYASLFFYLIYLGFVEYNFAPRITDTFKYNFQDASTQSRLLAWITMVENHSFKDFFLGIGMGNFHLKYKSITGIEGMDAHFDYVKIFIENGIFVFSFYIYFIFRSLTKILFDINSKFSTNYKLVFVLIINSFLFSSFHNSFFYFESLSLGTFLIGYNLNNS